MDERSKVYIVTAEIPQGSILGPLLWNIMCNEVLTLPFPEQTLRCFSCGGLADDLAVVITYQADVEIG